jgi:hypothetical protein
VLERASLTVSLFNGQETSVLCRSAVPGPVSSEVLNTKYGANHYADD